MDLKRAFAVVSVGIALTGCGASLKAMSAGQIGCKERDIKISEERTDFGSRTWTASCRGEQFSCSKVTVGAIETKDTHAMISEVSCSRMGGPTRYASSGGASSAPTARQASKGTVERKYDEQREMHVVRGTFKLSPGVDMHIIGAPQANLGTVAIVLAGSHWSGKLAECPKLDVLVNDQPFGTEQNVAKDLEGNKFNIESRFDFGVFRPLAQQFSTFGLRACGESWKLNEDQVMELKKFLVIYSQVAVQVQNGELPSREGQELGSPQGEDVPVSDEQPAQPPPRDGV